MCNSIYDEDYEDCCENAHTFFRRHVLYVHICLHLYMMYNESWVTSITVAYAIVMMMIARH